MTPKERHIFSHISEFFSHIDIILDGGALFFGKSKQGLQSLQGHILISYYIIVKLRIFYLRKS